MSLSERMARAREPLAPSGERDKPRLVPSTPAPSAGGPPRRPAPADEAQAQRRPLGYAATKAQIHDLLVERHAAVLDITDREAVRATIAGLVEEFVREHSLAVSALDHNRLIDGILDDVLGLGPLEPLL